MDSKLAANTSTTSKRSLWPKKTKDLYVIYPNHSMLELSDGKTYDDWCMGISAVTLGYRNWFSDISMRSPNYSFPSDMERQLADYITPNGHATRFFKTGSDAVSCAVRLARAYTQRSNVVVFSNCYHGTGDWHGPNLWDKSSRLQGGIPTSYKADISILGWSYSPTNSIDWSKTAAIVLEPIVKGITAADPEFYTDIREWANKVGVLVISDEIILGYRATDSQCKRHLLEPDIICRGKALAQGFPLSYTQAKSDIMRLLDGTVHFSGTNNGDRISLSVAYETLRRYERDGVLGNLQYNGQRLRNMLDDAGIKTEGVLDTRFNIVFDDIPDFVEYAFDHGILCPGFVSIATTHTNEQMERLVQCCVDYSKKIYQREFVPVDRIDIRNFEEKDAWFAYKLRHDKTVIKYSLTPAPDIETHQKWVNERINSMLYTRIAYVDNHPVGIAYVTLKHDIGLCASVSVFPGYRRMGIATKLLKDLKDRTHFTTLYAVINKDNTVSKKLFRNCDFRFKESLNEEYEIYSTTKEC